MIKYLRMVCGVFCLDSIIKKRIDEKEEEPDFILKKCKITRCRNKGVMYSIGKEYPEKIRVMSASVLAGVATYWFSSMVRPKNSRVEKIGASLLFGGSLSNVWDRFTRKYVVDYIHIDVKLLRNIIFNLSDICIVTGGCLTTVVNFVRILKEKE